MHDEMGQVKLAIGERDEKCQQDMKQIGMQFGGLEKVKADILSANSELTLAEENELGKVEAFRAHVAALKRHIESTGAYLKQEVAAVEKQFVEAKALMFKSVGVNIDDVDAVDEHLNREEEHKHIKALIEEQEVEDYEETLSQRGSLGPVPAQPPIPHQ